MFPDLHYQLEPHFSPVEGYSSVHVPSTIYSAHLYNYTSVIEGCNIGTKSLALQSSSWAFPTLSC